LIQFLFVLDCVAGSELLLEAGITSEYVVGEIVEVVAEVASKTLLLLTLVKTVGAEVEITGDTCVSLLNSLCSASIT